MHGKSRKAPAPARGATTTTATNGALAATATAAKAALSGLWVVPVGLGAVLAVTAAVALVSRAHSANTERSVALIERDAERSAWLIGNVEASLARLWAESLDTLTEEGANADAIARSIAVVDRHLDSDLRELPSALSPRAARGLRVITPDIDALRAQMKRALEARQRGQTHVAERLLDGVEEGHEQVAQELQTLAELAHEENTRALDAAEHSIAVQRRVEMSGFLALFAFTMLVSTTLLLLIAKQRRQLATHIGAIEGANKDLEAFAGRVAHDLKNMLAPIVLAVPLLKRAAKQTAQAQAQAQATTTTTTTTTTTNGALVSPMTSGVPNLVSVAERVDRAARRAIDLLEGLLAFARAGHPPGHNERAPVSEELDGVLEDLAVVADRVKATITVDVDADLEVATSPALLHVVLLNLIGNALKFLDGRRERRVTVTAERDVDRCRIVVADTGPGIPAAIRPRIFEPFYRAPGAKPGGTGIGLATVRRVVDAYRGTIAVDSVEGEGSSFHVTLPLAPEKPKPVVEVSESIPTVPTPTVPTTTT